MVKMMKAFNIEPNRDNLLLCNKKEEENKHSL